MSVLISGRRSLRVGRIANGKMEHFAPLSRTRPAILSFLLAVLLIPICVYGEAVGSAGTIQGTVLDPSGAAVAGAMVELHNTMTGYTRTTQTDDQGHFEFFNVPMNPYRLSVTNGGFQAEAQQMTVETSVPIHLRVKLQLATATTTVNVTSQGSNLIETTPVAHTDVGSRQIESLPIENPTVGLSSVITNASPGVVADANGFFHPLGEHADTSISLDGQPINDQESKIFANPLPMNIVQSMEIISGAVPAEYGDKTSLIVKTTTKSGLGQARPTGNLSAGYGSFGTWDEQFTLGQGGQKWGNFLALNSTGTSRYLNPPELQAFHDKGNSENVFDRIDFQPTSADSFHLNLSAARSWFQIPNTYDQLASGQDQHQQIRSTNVSLGWTHIFGTSTLLDFTPYFRLNHVQYYPSRDPFHDSPATVSQDRRLASFGFQADVAYTKGIHNAKAGVELSQEPLTENFGLGVTDPVFNPVCLASDGSAITNPTLTSPGQCGPAGFQPNPGLQAGLVPFDLTRGGQLFDFHGHTDIKELAFYGQDSIKIGNFTVNGGLRGDIYRGISRASAAEPRAGFSYYIKATNTVLRASYSRLFDTPYNENLILSSATGAGGLATSVLGAYASRPLVPGRRNQFNAGFEQGIGSHFVADAGYFWKFTQDDYDFDTLFNTPITFPIQWRKSKIDGASARLAFRNYHGFNVDTVLGHTRSRFFGPEVGGVIFNSPLNTGAFRIDHDEVLEQTTHVLYQHGPHWPWMAFTWRYDSGLVAGNVPDLASALALNGDQQAAIGFYCGNQAATLDNPITTCNLPYPQWGATRVQIPAPGSENDDTNPPRIAPRNLFDVGLGFNNLLHTDRYKMTLQLSVMNLTNKEALYNFLSTFSGTHFVNPRSFQAKLGFTF